MSYYSSQPLSELQDTLQRLEAELRHNLYHYRDLGKEKYLEDVRTTESRISEVKAAIASKR